tara:strand:+ start:121 stop:390 length:270 start_codon:yes stop_codon:yes gene_type:complete
MATKKTQLVRTNEKQIEVQKALFKKYGQERWDVIKLIKDVAPHATVDNYLEDTIVHLCYEVIKKDKPFQDVVKRLWELDPCTCDKHDDD